jgi:glycine cleavage system aminomethyltransferase T
MSHKNLQEAIQAAKSPVAMLRNSQIGPYAFPVVPSEFTNWRDEQRSWRETCALFDQSHHMTDLYVEGPDALKVFAALGVNTFDNFRVDTAKQFVACSHDGYVIGDAILFHLEPNKFNLVGRPPALNWVQFHVETGGYDATATRDERSFVNKTGGRKVYRYQVQGPNAAKVMAKATGKPMPDIKFFNMNTVTIGGNKVRALRHGMVGQPGWELFGPWAEGGAVRDALMEAGQTLGIQKVGARTYPTSTLESGWIPSPLPAVYSGAKMKPYRDWLGGDSYEAMASLGGSFVSRKIEDYYLTPYDLGYGPFVKFDHEFIGRNALEKHAKNPPRRKVTLAWNGEDVQKALGTLFSAGRNVSKYIDLPLANYATLPFDKVTKGSKQIGLSTYTGYSFNERSMLSLAVLDVKHAKPGTEVTLWWGEEDGGTSKPTVERHKQTKIRATVGPVPYGDTARTAYRPK